MGTVVDSLIQHFK